MTPNNLDLRPFKFSVCADLKLGTPSDFVLRGCTDQTGTIYGVRFNARGLFITTTEIQTFSRKFAYDSIGQERLFDGDLADMRFTVGYLESVTVRGHYPGIVPADFARGSRYILVATFEGR